jgi:thiol-disulfide isomerase/thioredoxin
MTHHLVNVPLPLPFLSFACIALLACGESGAAAPPPPKSRFEAVTAKTPSGDALAGFCDVRAEPGQGKPFKLPPLEAGATFAAQQGPLWVNLWATWCKPCVEEMPMIGNWQKQLEGQGKRVDVRFVSVDETPELVQTFRAQHPSLPASVRLAEAAALGPLVAELGLDSGAGLPIHVFVEPSARVRCVRAGAITDSHYAIVSSLL